MIKGQPRTLRRAKQGFARRRASSRLAAFLASALLLVACQPAAPGSLPPPAGSPLAPAATGRTEASPIAAASPTPGATATAAVPQPTRAATARTAATHIAELPASQPVTIPTADGASLEGTQFGEGSTAVIFANMSDSRQGTWEEMAQAVARRGYLALTFDFRYWENGRLNPALQDLAAQDLLAVIDYVRAERSGSAAGADQVVLVGASLGGMAAVKAGLSSNPAAVVLLAAPLEWPDWPSLRVSLEDIQNLAVPVLFVTSEGDRFAPDTQEMYAAAGQPKEMHTFSGDAHGTDLFGTPHAAELGRLLIAFLEAHAPAGQN